jgi:hypothetical protein
MNERGKSNFRKREKNKFEKKKQFLCSSNIEFMTTTSLIIGLILISAIAVALIYFSYRKKRNYLVIFLKTENWPDQEGNGKQMLILELHNKGQKHVMLKEPNLLVKKGKTIPFPLQNYHIQFPMMIEKFQDAVFSIETDKIKSLLLEAGSDNPAKLKARIEDTNSQNFTSKKWISISLSTSCKIEN